MRPRAAGVSPGEEASVQRLGAFCGEEESQRYELVIEMRKESVAV